VSHLRTYEHIPPTTEDAGVVNVVVEIPKGQSNKYELDKATGMFALNRCLYSSSHYPGDYGFIPQTLAEDRDALDVLVMVNQPTFSGCLIRGRVIGMFAMKDGGARDCKLLAVPDTDPLYAEYTQLACAPSHFLRLVENFFANYKQLEGVTIEPLGWSDMDDALIELQNSIARFKAASEEEVTGETDFE